MQNHGIIPAATIDFEQEYEDVDQNQYEHRRCAPKLTEPSGRSHALINGNRSGRTRMCSVGFQMAKKPDLLAQLRGGMQNLESLAKSPGRFKIPLRSELCDFSQCDCGQKQQEEPCRAPYISADMRPEKPCDNGYSQHDERGDAPTVIARAGPPCTDQYEERRNDRKEKENVVEIQSTSKNVRTN